MATATKTKKASRSNGSATITATQAEQLLEAEAAVRRYRAELDDAERRLAEVRKGLRTRVPLSTKQDEKKKKIRAAVIGGVSIRVTPSRTGPRFSLRRYKEAGHEVTPEMKEAITPGRDYDRWTVKAAGS